MKRVDPEPNFAAQLENTADYPKTAAIAYTAADLDASLIDAKTDYQNAASDNTGYYLSYLVRLRLWLTKGSRRWEYFIETFAGTSVPEGDPFGGPAAMRLGVGGSWSTVRRTRLG
jgi:hypothetical protein